MNSKERVPIPPLRMRDGNDDPYTRRENVEAELNSLHQLPTETVAERSEILDAGDANYVSSEAVLHFVRQFKSDGNSLHFQTLFKILRQRVLKAVPVSLKTLDSGKTGEDPYQLEVRQRVIEKFTEILCLDREHGYDQRLDYYEVMFNSAIATLRTTAKRDTSARLERERAEPLITDEAVWGQENDFEGVLENLNELLDSKDFVYRFELLSEISNLPDKQNRVVELLIQGYILKEVAEIVGCTEKTAGVWRNQARAALAKEIGREDLL